MYKWVIKLNELICPRSLSLYIPFLNFKFQIFPSTNLDLVTYHVTLEQWDSEPLFVLNGKCCFM